MSLLEVTKFILTFLRKKINFKTFWILSSLVETGRNDNRDYYELEFFYMEKDLPTKHLELS